MIVLGRVHNTRITSNLTGIVFFLVFCFFPRMLFGKAHTVVLCAKGKRLIVVLTSPFLLGVFVLVSWFCCMYVRGRKRLIAFYICFIFRHCCAACAVLDMRKASFRILYILVFGITLRVCCA